MRALIFGLALIVAVVLFRMLPRYEMAQAGAIGTVGAVLQMDKWTGAVRVCNPNTCQPWVGGAGPLS